MHASNKKSDEAQGFDSSAFEQAAIVFAFTGFAAAAISPDLHQFLAALSPLTPALKIAAGIFPMASEASRMGRVRALAKEAARARAHESERLEREAHVGRLTAERLHEICSPRSPSPLERELRRSLTARAREAEAVRLNAENALMQAADALRAALRRRERVMIAWEWDGVDPASQRDMRYPPPDETGLVPGVDEMGRVLAVAREDGGHNGLDYYYARRTRSLYSWISLEARAFVRTVKDQPAEAKCLAAVREARAFFWERMRAMRALDAEWGL